MIGEAVFSCIAKALAVNNTLKELILEVLPFIVLLVFSFLSNFVE